MATFDISNYTREELIRLREIIEMAMTAASLDDATAIEATTLFPEWEIDKAYVVDDKVKYNGVLYKVLQAHTSQESWKPDVSPSLFAQVLIPNPEVIPEWVQPDSTNPYKKNDKVKHNNKVWISLVDNNVWEPGATGTESLWSEVAE